MPNRFEYTFDHQKPFQNDPLKRGDTAKHLTQLVASTSQMVMSINAPWGQGKTTFIKMWAAHLRNESFATLYFNAWETDYADDPLISFMGQLREVRSADDDVVQKVGAKAREVAKKFIRASPKIALNYLLRGGLTYVTDGHADAKDEVEAISEIAAEFADQQIRAQEYALTSINNFKQELQEFAALVSRDGKPLVIFIDELDRCRPSCAVDFLEKIKHFFSVDGIVFVLAIDRERLGHAAASLLGFSPNDADGYLRRLIDLDFHLPLRSNEKFYRHWGNAIGLQEAYLEMHSNVSDSLSSLSSALGLSLRVQMQNIFRYYVISKAFPNRNKDMIYAASWLIPLVVYNRQLVEECWLKSYKPDRLITELISIRERYEGTDSRSAYAIERIEHSATVFLLDILKNGMPADRVQEFAERHSRVMFHFHDPKDVRENIWSMIGFGLAVSD